jgi:hypothetical protein
MKRVMKTGSERICAGATYGYSAGRLCALVGGRGRAELA